MKNKSKLTIIALLLIIVVVFTACGEANDSTAVEATDKVEAVDEPEESEEDKEAREEEEKRLVLQEREQLENERKDALGEFYVPLLPLDSTKEVETVKAKALYLTGNVAGFSFDQENIDYYADYILALSGKSGEIPDESGLNQVNKLERALGIAKATEINSMVIDVKNDHGHITWESNLEIVKEVGAEVETPFKNYQPLMEYLRENDIYTIARVVAFKDPVFADARPDHAILLKEGGVYKDNAGESWVNPFDTYVWDYVIAVSKEAALRGFNEIQFDYVRFPDRAHHYNPITEFPGRDGRDKDEGIEDFLRKAREELEPYNVHISADVFGFITHSWDDRPDDIGQTWRKIANQVDYICPMIYPSHYGTGLYGYEVPDRHPYEISRIAVMEALERNAAQKNPGIIRPWFQGFTASWVRGNIRYDEKAISDQMVAAAELGVEEYIIWSAGNNYNPLSFFYHDRIVEMEEEEFDVMGRTAEDALNRFLRAERSKRYTHLYLLTPIDYRNGDYDDFVEELGVIDSVLASYEINSIEKDEKGYVARVKVSYKSELGEYSSEDAEYRIIRENRVYKVLKPEIKW